LGFAALRRSAALTSDLISAHDLIPTRPDGEISAGSRGPSSPFFSRFDLEKNVGDHKLSREGSD
jgi:hypothetical protein